MFRSNHYYKLPVPPTGCALCREMPCMTSLFYCTGLPVFSGQEMLGQYSLCTDTTYVPAGCQPASFKTSLGGLRVIGKHS